MRDIKVTSRRLSHTERAPQITWGMVGLLWGIITSVCGHIWLAYMAGQWMGLWE